MNRIERMRATLGSMPGVAHFEVHDESSMHGAGRAGDSHMRVIVVSPSFEGMGSLARHRWVNALFKSELQSGLHALAVHARTPEEWSTDATSPASPLCAGKGK